MTLDELKKTADQAGQESGSASNGPPRREIQGWSEPVAHEREAPMSAGNESTGDKHAASEHSLWPFIIAVGLLLVGFGILSQVALAIIGSIVVLIAVIGWLWQPWTS